MKEGKSLDVKLPSGGLLNIARLAVMALLALGLATGCHKQDQSALTVDAGIVPTDPAVQSNLTTLTQQLHHMLTGPEGRIPTNFEDFVASQGVEPPPPPPGQKYSINKEMRVILVDANSK
jgi:hypothetical protein